MSNPGVRISVITVVYNSVGTISDAIQSIISQVYNNVELVVVDGASEDGTKELLNLYREHISVLISEPDEGIYDALNKGIANSSGDVIGFLHADDFFENPYVLSKVAEAFSDSSINIVYGDLVYVSKAEPTRVLRYWKAGTYAPYKLRRGWMPPHPTFYARRSLYDKVGVFDTSLRISADYDLMLRFLCSGEAVLSYVQNVMVRMRVGGESNRSIANIFTKSKEDYKSIRSNGVGGALTLLRKNCGKMHQIFIRR